MATQKTVLSAQARAGSGKGAARAVRRTGLVPAVIYGNNQASVTISMTEKELVKALEKKNFFTHLCDLGVDGKNHLVIPRDVQFDAVTDRPIHADFLRVSEKTIIRVYVPITVINQKDSPGIVKGGILNLPRHEIEVSVPATDIPEEFVVDLKGVDLGTSVHLEDLKLPKSVKPTIPGNFTVATLVAPTQQTEEAPAATAAAAAPAAAAAAGKDAKGAAAKPAAAAAKAPAKPAAKK
jgi:large subunit ribosomal protein L25